MEFNIYEIKALPKETKDKLIDRVCNKFMNARILMMFYIAETNSVMIRTDLKHNGFKSYESNLDKLQDAIMHQSAETIK